MKNRFRWTFDHTKCFTYGFN